MLTRVTNLCKTCKHVRMDKVYINDYAQARCMLFGNQCVVSGDITYLYAERCRRDNSMCGREGKHHKPREPPYSHS